MHTQHTNYAALLVGLVAVTAVGSYAYMVLRSTRHAVISTLVIGAAAAFVAVVFGTIVLPYTTFQPDPAAGLRPYTTRELVGRAIYLREGCWYCHSQFVRQQDRDLGPVAEAGQFVYDSPHALGTERTGPDLSNEGGKFPDGWHEIHISHPQSVRPGSVMPSFSFLMDRHPTDSNNHTFKYFDSKYQTWRDATDLDCLVLYLQSLGRRKAVTDEPAPDVPWEYRNVLDPQKKIFVPREAPKAIPYADRQIIQGAGMFNQFCAPCHGLSGRGDGYAGRDMWIPPANFTLPKYASWSDAKWFWRISEGVPGAQMPRWVFVLTVEQRWYLARFLQYVNASSHPDLERNPGLEKGRRDTALADRYVMMPNPKDPTKKIPKLDPRTHQPIPQPGVEGPPPLGLPLFTPAPPGANAGGALTMTLPVELIPAALRQPGAPPPTGLRPTVTPSLPGVGMVPGVVMPTSGSAIQTGVGGGA
ncbi:MAG: cbb3-type cytochrome c oxidase subunit II [Armatimonadota bacterium]|nr:cbb3-type cytochrome c oxidase subunit II [Armatimonadota bacterium]